LPENVLQLAQLKRNVKSSLAALPNYTCLETIQRSQRRDARQPFRLLDTVRVEVAVIKNRELYSWPGAGAFEDRSVSDMIGAGMSSTGSFVSSISNVLINNISTITWHGVEDLRGRRALRWDYSIPYNLSGWTLRIAGSRGNVSESGSFWADAQTLELLRLEINAGDIPPDLPITAANDSLDYSPMRVGSRDLLLPQTAESLITEWNGEQSRNVIEFSHCREFKTEARLTTDQPATVEKAASAVIEVSIPTGLHFAVRLAKPVDSQVAKVGDPLTAGIVSSVEYKRKELVPKGAILRGRIRLLERYSSPRAHYIVGLEFTDIEFPGHHARFFGEMTGITPTPGLSLTLSTSTAETRELGLGAGLTISKTETYLTVPVPGVSTFFMEGSSFRLPEGLLMSWRSVKLTR
jgi:hypothetical protein